MTSIRVQNSDEKAVRFALVKGKLPVHTLQSYFKNAVGLILTEGEGEIILPIVDNMILPRGDDWDDEVCKVIEREQSETKSSAPIISPTQVVMAPDRKIPTFEGRGDSSGKSVPVDEFVTSIKYAFERYSIRED